MYDAYGPNWVDGEGEGENAEEVFEDALQQHEEDLGMYDDELEFFGEWWEPL